MQFKTINTLRENTYRVRFETTASTAEVELIADFSEPTISFGGSFYANTVTWVDTPTIGTTITQGGAVGMYIYSGVLWRNTATSFTAGVAGDYTISASANVDYTLSASTKYISSDFPATQTFDNEVDAIVFGREIEVRVVAAVDALRANIDNFSSEVVKTI